MGVQWVRNTPWGWRRTDFTTGPDGGGKTSVTKRNFPCETAAGHFRKLRGECNTLCEMPSTQQCPSPCALRACAEALQPRAAQSVNAVGLC